MSINATTIPSSPINVPPSQAWQGNDGPWSSFTIQIGTPPQVANVFPGTAVNQQLVVHPLGCNNTVNEKVCAYYRGGLLYINESTTWQNNSAQSKPFFATNIEGRLGVDFHGLYGFDNMTLGFPGSEIPIVSNQSITTYIAKDFYLGVLGLNPRPVNFTDFEHPTPSFLQNLKTQKSIPSLAWGYTAGNQYRPGKALGSLVLGGYDSSRFIPNNISYPFSQYDEVDLSIHIHSITSTSSERLLLNNTISAFLDSSFPYIWLPRTACTLFEREFGIIWNDTLQLYLINDTQHDKLVKGNNGVVFTLGDFQSAHINITLPYAAFDLSLTAPIVNSTIPVRYFPLKRAANDSQYTLGRTFFQEVYVIADYERRNFSVSQAVWNSSAKINLVSILPPSSSGNSTLTHTSQGSKFPLGGIIGIVLAVLALLLLLFAYINKRRQYSCARRAADRLELEANELSKSSSINEAGWPKPELDGTTVDLKNKIGLASIYVQELCESDGQERFEIADDDNSGKRAVHELAHGVDVQVYELHGDGKPVEVWGADTLDKQTYWKAGEGAAQSEG